MFEERLAAIEALVEEELIEDQGTLVELLLKLKGIRSSQVQVSRDLKRLGIGKKKVGERMVYAKPDVNPQREMLQLAKPEVAYNESMIVVKTMAGLAPFVGDYLDARAEVGVLATLAGENTVLVVPEKVSELKKIYKQVCKALFYKGEG